MEAYKLMILIREIGPVQGLLTTIVFKRQLECPFKAQTNLFPLPLKQQITVEMFTCCIVQLNHRQHHPTKQSYDYFTKERNQKIN
jgi:hypothetical protein